MALELRTHAFPPFFYSKGQCGGRSVKFRRPAKGTVGEISAFQRVHDEIDCQKAAELSHFRFVVLATERLAITESVGFQPSS